MKICSSLCLNKPVCSLNAINSIVPYCSSSEFCPFTAYRRYTDMKVPQVIYFDESCCNESQVLITPLSHTISSRVRCFQSSKVQPAPLQSELPLRNKGCFLSLFGKMIIFKTLSLKSSSWSATWVRCAVTKTDATPPLDISILTHWAGILLNWC